MSKKQEKESKVPNQKDLIKSLRGVMNSDGVRSWDLTKEDSPTHVSDWLSTGSTLLDYTISNRRNGGVPVRKIVELQGEEASGKSLICAHLIAETQKRGGIAIYLDTENATNVDFMRRIGVKVEELVYVQPGTIEKAFELIEASILSIREKDPNRLFLICWDSVGNTPPQAEIEGDYDPNSRIGLGAKAMAKGLRKINDLLGKQNVAIVFTQPLKYSMNADKYSDPFVTVYGKALPYFATVRIRLTSSTKLKDKDNVVYGIICRANIIKSRLGTSFRTCKFQIHYDHGIEDEQSWFDVLHEDGSITKKGGWCYIGEIPSGKIQPSGVDAGKDIGISFREDGFGELARNDQRVRSWCLDKLEQILVKKWNDASPVEMIDEESGNPERISQIPLDPDIVGAE